MAFLLFVSCSRISCPWKTQTLVSSCPVYVTERYLLHPRGIIDDIEVELIRTGSAYSLYINILYKPLEISEKTIELVYSCAGTDFHTSAFIMEGGQRILFPPEASQQIAGFLQNSPVSVSFAQYRIVIPPL